MFYMHSVPEALHILSRGSLSELSCNGTALGYCRDQKFRSPQGCKRCTQGIPE
jgi:hypothetical protein